ncbi:rho GTPase-activating protein 11A-like isoform X2 [Myxocyprinus asiaticus]|uniref:rho GTPase-activating protein 11A-like isoform X2 n=1 Tax=Myxocyprinus asiaticus TaxID=70543 RepID=UPI0022233CDF|nr:rho GTPase-activating protein 11A-like isoform X2 [Myxocyprinus asiaticus]
MKVLERNVVRLAVVQHLRSVYGIKIKNWNKNRNKQTSVNTVRVFGVALESLPHCHVLDYGDIPCFIVDVCTSLMEHLDTEGLFRKSGSVVRVKTLRGKLDQGEDCLDTALPLDIAGLLKQFFRELPEPVLTVDLHSAFLKSQELPTEEERTSTTVLLSCVLPDRNLNTLRYFCSFLKNVSQRCAENKMDSSNLSVIFAPNLFHCGDVTEKLSSSTEKRLKHQTAAVQCLIDNAQHLGVVPQFLMEKVPAMLGCDFGIFSPSTVSLEESSTHSDMKKSNRRSLGDVVNGALNKFKTSRTPTRTPQSDGAVFSTATPIIMTPNTKRKLPVESAQTHGFSKKRRSIKKNLGLELLPNTLFGGTSTPGSAHSAGGVLESSHNGFLFSVGRNSRLSSSSARRKSKRLQDQSVSRVESGKAGCFSPRVHKKEPVRKSLRLRFSLGKSSRESNIITHSQLGPKGSEVIGWRLATQESCTGFNFTTESAFSPAVLNKSPSKGSKFISKSEDNLLTPQCDSTDHRSLWSGDTPDVAPTFTTDLFSGTPMSVCRSEPIIVVSKTLCYASNDSSGSDSFNEERSHSGPNLLKIKRVFGESGSDLHSIINYQSENPKDKPQDNLGATSEAVSSEVTTETSPKSMESSSKCIVDDHNMTFGQLEMIPLSPLHIDSTLFDTEPRELAEITHNSSLCLENKRLFEATARSGDCSQLIDALDIQSPVAFRPDTSIRVQSTPYVTRTQTKVNTPLPSELKASKLGDCPPNREDLPQNSPNTVEMRRLKVADQIQLFNMLTLQSPKAKVVRSPLKFQRTPVRQSVRRLNSLLGDRKDVRMGWCASQSTAMPKAMNLESGLCNRHIQTTSSKPKPPVPSKKHCTVKHAILEDVTNKVPKANALSANKNAPTEYPKSVCLELAEKDSSRYRGSPKNPLSEGRLLSAMKPIDL